MDDRRFDSLVRSLATGASRRSILKGMLGFGGATVTSGVLLESDTEAARRPTPTPKPPTCPGRQIRQGGICVCPPGLSKCGPDCCNDDEQRVFPNGTNNPNYTECCDNACCQGKCFGEELCCPYTRTWCEATQECCPIELPYCCGDGCCARPCCDTSAGNVCCEGDTPKCCPGDICIPTDGCCTDAECPGCQSCENHICVDDRANCPGGVAGCDDCVSATCVANNSRCDDGQTCNDDTCAVKTGQCSHPFNCHGSNDCCTGGNACTNHSCLGDGSCDYSPNCNGSNTCCTGGSTCTNHTCLGDGTCDYSPNCNGNNACCTGGSTCTNHTCLGDGTCDYSPNCNGNDDCCAADKKCVDGACVPRCAGIGIGCDSDSDCCEGSCWDLPTGDVCFVCLPDLIPCATLPVPNACDHCCNHVLAGVCSPVAVCLPEDSPCFSDGMCCSNSCTGIIPTCD